MEAVLAVVKQYKRELVALGENVVNQGGNVQGLVQDNVNKTQTVVGELQPKVTEKMQLVQSLVGPSMQDMSAVPDQAHQALLQSHIWAGVCLFAITVSQMLGSSVLSPFIGMMFDAKYSFLLGYMLLPTNYYLRVTRGKMQGEEQQRLTLLYGSILVGLLSGYTISDRVFSFFAPPSFIIASGVGLVAGMMGQSVGGNRQTYLGTVVGAGVGVSLVLGLVSGSMGLGFLVYMVLAGGATAAVAQLVIGGLVPGNALAAEVAIVAHLTIQYVMSYMLGSSKEALAAAAADAAA